VRDVELVVVPWDSARRGERMGAGPGRLLDAGLPALLERRGRRVSRRDIDPPEAAWRAEIATAFALAREVEAAVRGARAAGHVPLVLSGNCGVSLGVVAALGAGTRVLWFDAHGDFNTPETTVGGFLDGMALATLTGHCWRSAAATVPGFLPVPESHVVLLGARDLDPLEAGALGSSAVRRVAAGALDASLGAALGATLAAGPWYLHLDLDVLDPSEGRVNRYAAPGGARLADLVAALRSLRGVAPPAAMTLSAYDPSFDDDGRVADAALALVDAAFGG
jgi:arginase